MIESVREVAGMGEVCIAVECMSKVEVLVKAEITSMSKREGIGDVVVIVAVSAGEASSAGDGEVKRKLEIES